MKDWLIYSKNSNGNTVDKKTDDGLGSWVFCAPGKRSYMTFRNGNKTFPLFEQYRLHDAWQVYEYKASTYTCMQMLLESAFEYSVTLAASLNINGQPGNQQLSIRKGGWSSDDWSGAEADVEEEY